MSERNARKVALITGIGLRLLVFLLMLSCGQLAEAQISRVNPGKKKGSIQGGNQNVQTAAAELPEVHFRWGPFLEHPFGKENPGRILRSDEEGLWMVYTEIDPATFVRSTWIASYSPDLKENWVTLVHESSGKKGQSRLLSIGRSSNGGVELITLEKDNTLPGYHLNQVVFDWASLSIIGSRYFHSFPVEEDLSKCKVGFSQSPNEMFYAFFCQYPEEKDQNEQLKVWVWNSTLFPVYDKEVGHSAPFKEIPENRLFVNDSGEIQLIKKVVFGRNKYQHWVYSSLNHAKKVVSHPLLPLKSDLNEIFLMDYRAWLEPDSRLVIAGYFTFEPGKGMGLSRPYGTFVQILDAETKGILVSKAYTFADNLRFPAKNVEENGFPHLRLKEVLPAWDGGWIMIGEEVREFSRQTGSNNDGTAIKEETRSFQDIIFTRIATSGGPVWTTRIARHVDLVNEQRVAGSFSAFWHNDSLLLLFNEKEYKYDEKSQKLVIGESSHALTPVLSCINARAEITSKGLFNTHTGGRNAKLWMLPSTFTNSYLKAWGSEGMKLGSMRFGSQE